MFDDDPTSLSAASALLAMVVGDPCLVASASSCPLFRDPSTGVEITYTAAANDVKSLLRRAGLHDLATGLHSLRIGGSTAAANDPHGGEFISGCMGLWASNSKRRYMFAMRDNIERAAVSMARARHGGVLAVRPGLVAAYS